MVVVGSMAERHAQPTKNVDGDGGGVLNTEEDMVFGSSSLAPGFALRDGLRDEVFAARKALNETLRGMDIGTGRALPFDGSEMAPSCRVRPSSGHPAASAVRQRAPTSAGSLHVGPSRRRRTTGKNALCVVTTTTTVTSDDTHRLDVSPERTSREPRQLVSHQSHHAALVEKEILHWQEAAARESNGLYQSVFRWALHELEDLDQREVREVPDGPLKGIPSHFRVHTTFTILTKVLEAVCADSALVSRLVDAVRRLMLLPPGAAVSDVGALQQAAQYVSLSALPADAGADDSETDGASLTQTQVVPEDPDEGKEAHCDEDGQVLSGSSSAPRRELSNLQSPAAASPVGETVSQRPAASWMLVLQKQDEHLTSLVQRLKSSNSAIIALRGLLRSVFHREDVRRIRTTFTAWRLYTRDIMARRRSTSNFFFLRSNKTIKGLYFRGWARVVATMRRSKLLRVKEEAVVGAKLMERRLKEAVQAGREEVSRELDKMRVLLSEERGQRERQYQSFSSELESVTDEMSTVRYYLQLTCHHKELWRSLWLTHHRETRLPHLISGTVGEEAGKLKDALRIYIAALRSAPDQQQSSGPPATPARTLDSASSPSEPSSVQAHSLAPPVGGATATLESAPSLRSKCLGVRAKVESFLTAWVNDVLVRLNVQRFLIAVRDDLSDGIIFQALCHTLDRTKRDNERFVEEHARRLPLLSVARRLLGTLRQAGRRLASMPMTVPMLQLCPTLHDHVSDERNVLVLFGPDDPWYLWVLSTLFVDYCFQQLYPEPQDSVNLPPVFSSAAQTTKRVRRGSNSTFSSAAANGMSRDAFHFAVAPERRSEFFLPEAIDDAAEYSFTSPMRVGVGAPTAGLFQAIDNRVGGRSGSAANKLQVPFSGSHGSSLGGRSGASLAPSAPSSARQPVVHKVPAPPTSSARPPTTFLPIDVFGEPPAGSRPPSRTSLSPSSAPLSAAKPVKGKGGHPSRAHRSRTSPVSTSTSPAEDRETPVDDGDSAVRSGWALQELALDAEVLHAAARAGDTVPVSPDKASASCAGLDTILRGLPLMRGPLEYAAVASAVAVVAGKSDDAASEDDVSDITARTSAVVTPTLRCNPEAAQGRRTSNASSISASHGAVGTSEFDAVASRRSPPPPPWLTVVPHSDGDAPRLALPYDAIVCGRAAEESQRRKGQWIDVCRLVVASVASYGVLERIGVPPATAAASAGKSVAGRPKLTTVANGSATGSVSGTAQALKPSETRLPALENLTARGTPVGGLAMAAPVDTALLAEDQPAAAR